MCQFEHTDSTACASCNDTATANYMFTQASLFGMAVKGRQVAEEDFCQCRFALPVTHSCAAVCDSQGSLVFAQCERSSLQPAASYLLPALNLASLQLHMSCNPQAGGHQCARARHPHNLHISSSNTSTMMPSLQLLVDPNA